MRHRTVTRRLSRNTSHREAMLRNMVTSLFEHEKILTTDAKAKVLRPLAERLITLAKRGDLHARRQALAVIRRREVVAKLFDEIITRYTDRHGGYIRLTKTEPRRGDAAPMSVVELLDAADKKAAQKKTPAKKKAAAKKKAPAKTPAKQATDQAAEAKATTEPEATKA